MKQKLGDNWHDGFGYITAVFVGERTVLKFETFPVRAGRFNHERAVTDMELPGAMTPRILDEGVIDGYEWIEQSVVPGRPAYEVWPGMSESSRAALVERMAECIAAMQRFGVDESALHSRFDSWRDHVTAAAKSAMGKAVGIVPAEMLELARGRVDEWGESLTETERVTCHGDLWFGNVFVDDAGKLTGIIDWDRLAVAPAEYEIDMLWRFWRYPWDFVPDALMPSFEQPIDPALLRPIVEVATKSMDASVLNARLSMLELAMRIGITARFGWSDKHRDMLETVLSGHWTNGLTG